MQFHFTKMSRAGHIFQLIMTESNSFPASHLYSKEFKMHKPMKKNDIYITIYIIDQIFNDASIGH